MNMKRTATIVVVGGALLAWLAGAATSNREPPPPVFERVAPIEMRGAELASEVARLHERLRPVASPRRARAQPLRVSRRRASGRCRRPVAPKPAPLTEGAPPPIAQPSLKLSGIAEDAGPDGPVRLAFIAGEGQLFMVKEGDRIASRYRVNKISADVVELTDLADNSARRLAMK